MYTQCYFFFVVAKYWTQNLTDRNHCGSETSQFETVKVHKCRFIASSSKAKTREVIVQGEREKCACREWEREGERRKKHEKKTRRKETKMSGLYNEGGGEAPPLAGKFRVEGRVCQPCSVAGRDWGMLGELGGQVPFGWKGISAASLGLKPNTHLGRCCTTKLKHCITHKPSYTSLPPQALLICLREKHWKSFLDLWDSQC